MSPSLMKVWIRRIELRTAGEHGGQCTNGRDRTDGPSYENNLGNESCAYDEKDEIAAAKKRPCEKNQDSCAEG